MGSLLQHFASQRRLQKRFSPGELDNARPVQLYMNALEDSAVFEGAYLVPRRWFPHVGRMMTDSGWRADTLDFCCFLQAAADEPGESTVVAVPGIHVDYVICARLPGYEEFLKQIKKAFEWGSAREKNEADSSFLVERTH